MIPGQAYTKKRKGQKHAQQGCSTLPAVSDTLRPMCRLEIHSMLLIPSHPIYRFLPIFASCVPVVFAAFLGAFVQNFSTSLSVFLALSSTDKSYASLTRTGIRILKAVELRDRLHWQHVQPPISFQFPPSLDIWMDRRPNVGKLSARIKLSRTVNEGLAFRKGEVVYAIDP